MITGRDDHRDEALAAHMSEGGGQLGGGKWMRRVVGCCGSAGVLQGGKQRGQVCELIHSCELAGREEAGHLGHWEAINTQLGTVPHTRLLVIPTQGLLTQDQLKLLPH